MKFLWFGLPFFCEISNILSVFPHVKKKYKYKYIKQKTLLRTVRFQLHIHCSCPRWTNTETEVQMSAAMIVLRLNQYSYGNHSHAHCIFVKYQGFGYVFGNISNYRVPITNSTHMCVMRSQSSFLYVVCVSYARLTMVHGFLWSTRFYNYRDYCHITDFDRGTCPPLSYFF